MLDFYGQTDVGRRREHNEDTIYAHGTLFLVCDGMGGHQAGEVASRLAAEVIVDSLSHDAEASDLGMAIKRANRAIHAQASAASEYAGMGTTVAAVLVHPRRPQITYAHVGDSRIYLVREGAMQQLGRDDTWANLGGEHSGMVSLRHVLTKALGVRDEVEFDVDTATLQDDDVVLLCSDGLTNMVSDRRILDIVLARLRDPRAACAELVAGANAEGGHDNISVILLRYHDEGQVA
jgi:protein phosphatase